MVRQSVRRSGFTLIELSIVLVIIGLIAGGVLAGRELIEVAKIRSTVAQLERLNAAENAFKLKYNAIAGDMPDPEKFFSVNWDGTAISYLQGNGNGVIDWPTATNAYIWLFFYESGKHFGLLQTAGLINEKYDLTTDGGCGPTKVPLDGFAGRIGVYTNAVDYTSAYNSAFQTNADMQNYYLVGMRINWGDCNAAVSTGIWTPTQVASFDRKIDDGYPLTGKVRVTTGDGFLSNLIYTPVPAQMHAHGLCNLNDDGSYGTDLYNGTETGCNIRIQASW